MVGDLGTDDLRHGDNLVQINLTHRGDRMQGCLIAVPPKRPEGGAPGRRMGNALAFWMELKRPSYDE